MGRKRKIKIVPLGKPLYKVYIDDLRPPVGGFPTKKEAELFARNTITPSMKKHAILKERIIKYQPFKKVPAFQGLP